MNARLFLIAACIAAVLFVLRAATPDPAHAQQNEGDQSQADARNPATPLATPEPYRFVARSLTIKDNVVNLDFVGLE